MWCAMLLRLWLNIALLPQTFTSGRTLYCPDDEMMKTEYWEKQTLWPTHEWVEVEDLTHSMHQYVVLLRLHPTLMLTQLYAHPILCHSTCTSLGHFSSLSHYNRAKSPVGGIWSDKVDEKGVVRKSVRCSIPLSKLPSMSLNNEGSCSHYFDGLLCK